MGKFKIAILGAGHIASKMAEAIKGLEEIDGIEIEAYAIASRDLNKAKEFSEKWKFTKYYGSYEELVSDENIDLVYIATPHAMHYENAKLCIEHDKSVLVEKAFTANLQQAKRLIELSHRKDVFLTEAIWTRYMPGLKIIKEMISCDKIGVVDSIEADFSIPIVDKQRMHDPSLAGGALLDLGIYTLTFASMFLGNDILSMRSRCIKYTTGVDATDHIELKYKDGRQAFLRTSMISDTGNEGRINGTKGYINVSNLTNMEKIQVFDSTGKLIETVVPKKIVNGYEYELLACMRAIKEGKIECEEMPHEETLLMMEWMDSLRKSWGVVYPFE